MLGLQGMCPLWPPFQSSAEGNPGLPLVPPAWGFFRAKAPEADAAVPIASDLKPEVPGTANTFTFVNGNLLLPHERSLIPWTYAFNFSLKLQSNKLPAHIFLCQMFPLWWIWSTLGPAFEPHPLPVLPQTLLFSVKLISSFPPRSGYIWYTVVPEGKRLFHVDLVQDADGTNDTLLVPLQLSVGNLAW